MPRVKIGDTVWVDILCVPCSRAAGGGVLYHTYRAEVEELGNSSGLKHVVRLLEPRCPAMANRSQLALTSSRNIRPVDAVTLLGELA